MSDDDMYWPYLYKQRNKERVCQMMTCTGHTCTKKEIKSLCVSKEHACQLLTCAGYTCTKKETKSLCLTVSW